MGGVKTLLLGDGEVGGEGEGEGDAGEVSWTYS